MIYALGGEDRLVGRTDFCDYPPAARAKTSVGGMINPSLETHRHAQARSRHRDQRRQPRGDLHAARRASSIPVYQVGAERIADVKDVARRLGALTGREAAVGAAARRASTAASPAVREAVRPYGRPRVLYVLWPDPLHRARPPRARDRADRHRRAATASPRDDAEDVSALQPRGGGGEVPRGHRARQPRQRRAGRSPSTGGSGSRACPRSRAGASTPSTATSCIATARASSTGWISSRARSIPRRSVELSPRGACCSRSPCSRPCSLAAAALALFVGSAQLSRARRAGGARGARGRGLGRDAW